MSDPHDPDEPPMAAKYAAFNRYRPRTEVSTTQHAADWNEPDATIRPATTDQRPAVYGATQPARLVITETVAASRTQGDGPWTTAEAILAALDREGYRIFRPVDESLDVWGDEQPLQPPRPMTDEEATEFERRWSATVAPRAPRVCPACGFPPPGGNKPETHTTDRTILERVEMAAPRASEAVMGDVSPTPDVGAAQGGEGGSAAESEPRCESTHPDRDRVRCTLPAGHDTHRRKGEAWTTLDRLDGHVLVSTGDLAEVLRYVIGADTFSVVTNETLDRLFADLKEATEADQ